MSPDLNTSRKVKMWTNTNDAHYLILAFVAAYLALPGIKFDHIFFYFNMHMRYPCVRNGESARTQSLYIRWNRKPQQHNCYISYTATQIARHRPDKYRNDIIHIDTRRVLITTEIT
jgi:hypothetical protein